MVTAKILDVITDENNNMKVTTEYSLNGQVIQIGNTRYSFSNKATLKDIEDLIDVDIDIHCQNLIVRTYAKNKNTSTAPELKTAISGKTYSTSTGTFRVGNTKYTVNTEEIVSEEAVLSVVVE